MHMDMDSIRRVSVLARDFGIRSVLISGGEPTEHPHFWEIAEMFRADFPIVAVLTNGCWVGDADMEKRMSELASRNVFIQLTSVKGIYKNYPTINANRARLERMGIAVCSEPLNILALGRARESKAMLELNRKNPYMCSCFSHSLASAQVGFREAIRISEARGRLCYPFIDWKGGIHASESCLCPSFATILDANGYIEKKARAFRPCGGCKDYKRLLRKTEPKYVTARAILGIGGD